MSIKNDVEYTPLTETELISMIDLSIAQADRGEVYSLDEVMAYIDAEFGLVESDGKLAH